MKKYILSFVFAAILLAGCTGDRNLVEKNSVKALAMQAVKDYNTNTLKAEPFEVKEASTCKFQAATAIVTFPVVVKEDKKLATVVLERDPQSKEWKATSVAID